MSVCPCSHHSASVIAKILEILFYPDLNPHFYFGGVL